MELPALFLLQRTIPLGIIGTPQRLDDEERVTRSRLCVRSGLFLRKSANCLFENEAFLPATETPQQSSRRRPMVAAPENALSVKIDGHFWLVPSIVAASRKPSGDFDSSLVLPQRG